MIPCYKKYEVFVKSLFYACPAISFYVLPHEAHWAWGAPPEEAYDRAQADNFLNKDQEIRLGSYFSESSTEKTYLQAGIELCKRWESDPTAEASEHVFPQVKWPNENRIFVHDDPTRDRVITKDVDRNTAFYPAWVPNILQYAHILKTADEIHVIDSSFRWLAMALKLKAHRLCLHHYAWPCTHDDTGSQNWNIIL